MTPRSAALLLLAFLGAACAREETETWGFVATLGDDTTSIERITRRGDRVTGLAVGRSPRVVLRRWQATLAPDGTVRTWSMDTRLANAPAGESELHHEFDLADGRLRVVRRTGRDTTERTFTPSFARMVPWNAFLYATFDDLIRVSAGLADTTRIGIYFFEGWQEGRLGYANVLRRDDGTLGITSSGLAGEGTARVDDEGRLTSYSGEGTTYKQEVRRVSEVPDPEAAFERFAAEERARGVSPVLSARDTLRATVAGVSLLVDYSRPLARGRRLVGGLIPYDRVWRTGANAATQITVGAPVLLAGVPLDPGTYTLWTLPARDGVQLIINRQTGQWGTAYNPRHDLARVPMRVESSPQPVEHFTIRADSAASRLVMEWGDFRWSVPVAPR